MWDAFREVCLQVLCISLSSKAFWLPSAFSVSLIFKLSGRLVLRDRSWVGFQLMFDTCRCGEDKAFSCCQVGFACSEGRLNVTLIGACEVPGAYEAFVCVLEILKCLCLKLLSCVVLWWLAVHHCLQWSSSSESWLFSKEIKNLVRICWELFSWWINMPAENYMSV